jgi:hypothetical protein
MGWSALLLAGRQRRATGRMRSMSAHAAKQSAPIAAVAVRSAPAAALAATPFGSQDHHGRRGARLGPPEAVRSRPLR